MKYILTCITSFAYILVGTSLGLWPSWCSCNGPWSDGLSLNGARRHHSEQTKTLGHSGPGALAIVSVNVNNMLHCRDMARIGILPFLTAIFPGFAIGKVRGFSGICIEKMRLMEQVSHKDKQNEEVCPDERRISVRFSVFLNLSLGGMLISQHLA